MKPYLQNIHNIPNYSSENKTLTMWKFITSQEFELGQRIFYFYHFEATSRKKHFLIWLLIIQFFHLKSKED